MAKSAYVPDNLPDIFFSNFPLVGGLCMSEMKFFQLDPRPQRADANEAIFAEAERLGVPIIGIEVTLPTYASKCMVNFDHHGPSDTAETPSATAQMGTWLGENWTDLVPVHRLNEAVFVTVRPDSDSITAMAQALAAIEYGVGAEKFLEEVDRFDRLGPSAGPFSTVLRAIARKAGDHRIPLEDRVRWVADLIAGGSDEQREEISRLAEEADRELEVARAASEVNLRAGGRLATVVSTHRFGTTLGYESAPVVVAQNPEMPVDPKDSSKGVCNKFTVCRYDSHVAVDLPAALAELQALESGWGGRGDIFGSPQGVSSTLTLDQVVEVVTRHLK
jgi:hypothetical protein